MVLTALALAPGSAFFGAIAVGVGLWALVMLAGLLSDRLALDIRALHYPLYFTSMLASLTIGTMRAVFSGGLEMWTSQRLE